MKTLFSSILFNLRSVFSIISVIFVKGCHCFRRILLVPVPMDRLPIMEDQEWVSGDKGSTGVGATLDEVT